MLQVYRVRIVSTHSAPLIHTLFGAKGPSYQYEFPCGTDFFIFSCRKVKNPFAHFDIRFLKHLPTTNVIP